MVTTLMVTTRDVTLLGSREACSSKLGAVRQRSDSGYILGLQQGSQCLASDPGDASSCQTAHPSSCRPSPRLFTCLSYRRPATDVMTSAVFRSVSPSRFKSPIAAALMDGSHTATRGSSDRTLAIPTTPVRTSLRSTTVAPRYTPPLASALEETYPESSLGPVPEVRIVFERAAASSV